MFVTIWLLLKCNMDIPIDVNKNNKASHTIYIYKPIELSVIVIEVNFTTF